MRHFLTRGALMALAFCTAPAALAAQQQPAQQQMPPQVQQWIAELQQVQERLGSAFEQAMENRELREEQEQIAAAMDAAILAAHPTIEQDMRRAGEIQAEAARAHQAGDEETLTRLTREFEAIDRRLGEAQMQALESEGLGERMESFQARLIEQMRRHEPRTEQLIQQRQELQLRIETAMQQAAAG